MIRVRHIFVSHPPHEKGQVTIWPSLRSAKNVKKQQEVSDLNQDYQVTMLLTWQRAPYKSLELYMELQWFIKDSYGHPSLGQTW